VKSTLPRPCSLPKHAQLGSRPGSWLHRVPWSYACNMHQPCVCSTASEWPSASKQPDGQRSCNTTARHELHAFFPPVPPSPGQCIAMRPACSPLTPVIVEAALVRLHAALCDPAHVSLWWCADYQWRGLYPRNPDLQLHLEHDLTFDRV
jgi:hypothetical protein